MESHSLSLDTINTLFKILFEQNSIEDLLRTPSHDYGKAFLSGSYGGFPVSALLKAHLLPYLIEISSERALDRELAEKPTLQELCVFSAKESSAERTPTRSTLWFFRKKYEEGFYFIVRRLLVSLSVIANVLDISLPYVRKIGDSPDLSIEFEQDKSETCQVKVNEGLITVKYGEWKATSEQIRRELTIGGWVGTANRGGAEARVKSHEVAEQKPLFPELFSEIEIEGKAADKRKPLFYGIGFPLIVVAVSASYGDFVLGLEPPYWLSVHNRHFHFSADRTGIPSGRKGRYMASHIVLTKKSDSGGIQILLGKRKSGFGKGLYELPGGKVNPRDRSVLESVERELLEETALKFVSGCPISTHVDNYPDKPKVISVGVVVSETRRKIQQNREPGTGMWEWHDLRDLPQNIFEPSRKVIEKLKRRFPDLERNKQYFALAWDDIELVLRDQKSGADFYIVMAKWTEKGVKKVLIEKGDDIYRLPVIKIPYSELKISSALIEREVKKEIGIKEPKQLQWDGVCPFAVHLSSVKMGESKLSIGVAASVRKSASSSLSASGWEWHDATLLPRPMDETSALFVRAWLDARLLTWDEVDSILRREVRSNDNGMSSLFDGG